MSHQGAIEVRETTEHGRGVYATHDLPASPSLKSSRRCSVGGASSLSPCAIAALPMVWCPARAVGVPRTSPRARRHVRDRRCSWRAARRTPLGRQATAALVRESCARGDAGMRPRALHHPAASAARAGVPLRAVNGCLYGVVADTPALVKPNPPAVGLCGLRWSTSRFLPASSLCPTRRISALRDRTPLSKHPRPGVPHPDAR